MQVAVKVIAPLLRPSTLAIANQIAKSYGVSVRANNDEFIVDGVDEQAVNKVVEELKSANQLIGEVLATK